MRNFKHVIKIQIAGTHNMKNRLPILIAAIVFPLAGMAESLLVAPWSADDRTANAWIRDKTGEAMIQATIAYGKGGGKNIYFDIYDYDVANDKIGDKDYCNPYDYTSADQGVAILNGQAIKIYQWCKKFADSKKHYLQITAATDQGGNFISSQLAKAPKSIELEVDGRIFTISAEGFSQIWNKTSNRAL